MLLDAKFRQKYGAYVSGTVVVGWGDSRDIETQVLDARRDVLKVAECVIPIAGILPRTGDFGGG
jgi:hypothetical protein